MNRGRSERVEIELSSSTGKGHIAHRGANHQRPTMLSSAGSALLLAGLLTLGVTGWEHLFHAAHLGLPGSVGDHLAHVLRDGALAFPIGLVAVVATRLLARMPCLRGGGRGGDLLVRAALLSLVFGALLIPSVGLHGVADSFFDPDGGADAHGLGHDPLEADASLAGLALHGIRDALLSQLAAFPLALAGLKLEELAHARPRRGLLVSPLRVRRLALAGVGALAAALLPTSADNAEPQGSIYLDPQTGQPLNTSNWEAIIQPATGTRFRESTIVYHKVGDETFQLSTSSGGKLPLNDPFTTTYRPGGRALNYRSEPFFDRMQVMNNAIGSFDESQGYGSYMFGDPSTPIPRSYLGEPTKTRLVHAGSEQAHVHHLHGGGDRWRQSPGADNTNDISGGLEKYPVQQVKSIRLDSQTINPGESYTLEHECGAGGCQQVAGDFLFHCHIAHHYLAGMWGLWRVFDTVQPDLATIPGRAVAPTAVTSDQLLGRTVPTVSGNRTIVLQSQLTDPTTQIALEALVENQLPPASGRPSRPTVTPVHPGWVRPRPAPELTGSAHRRPR